MAKAVTEDARLEEKQTTPLVKAMIDEQIAANKADDDAVRQILQDSIKDDTKGEQ